MKTIIDILRRSRKSSMSDAARIIIHYPLSIINLLLLLAVTTSCERRELYVYGDEYRSVELNVDWRKYSQTDPDGMTAWFYPLNTEQNKPYRITTANVRRHELYLPGGLYRGMVIDYSPEEFGHQLFLDLDNLEGARVEARPAAYQPDEQTMVGDGVPADLNDQVNAGLFSEDAWTEKQAERTGLNDNGLYLVADQPQEMALDTLDRVIIDRGEYGDYIPWKKRETYQSTINIKKIYSVPEPLIWKIRVRVWIKDGFNYIWRTPSSLTGLADGHYLPLDINSDRSCLMRIDEWEMQRTGENTGYIAVTLSTFGLRPGSVLPTRELHEAANTRAAVTKKQEPFKYVVNPGEWEPNYPPAGWTDYYTGNCEQDEMRLNLSFTLRDHATTLQYHFNVGELVVSYDTQRALRVELGPDFFYPNNPNGPQPIILPYVEAYGGTGFDATVTPWEDGGTAETTM